MKSEVFDERASIIGEGPTSSGAENEIISWVDIYGRKVFTRNLITGEVSEFDTAEDVGFAIPRQNGGHVLGVTSGPVLRDADGTIHRLPTRADADGFTLTRKLRWNDAKVSPQGELFLGTMAYDHMTNAGAFYQLRKDGKHIRRLFGDVSISNGLDWTVDKTKMFYIDSSRHCVDRFDIEERDIKNRQTFIEFPLDMGTPDGMSIDSQDNLWIAFWLGHAVRCFDGRTGKQIEEISCSAPRSSSCVFGGPNLDQLFITSASENTDLTEFPEAGMTFVATPGVQGQKTALFQL